MIRVEIFYAHNELRNFSYIVSDQQTGECWVIDPYDDKILAHYIKKNQFLLRGILNTHQHWDHIQGNLGLETEFKCSVHRALSQIQLNSQYFIQIIKTPGHTSDHICFKLNKGNDLLGLFSGDTLFNSGVGNCRGGGSVDDLFETIQSLKNLPDELVLYPGHDYVLKNLLFAQQWEPDNKAITEALKWVRSSTTEQGLRWTLGQERAVNPFLRLNSAELRQNLLKVEKDFEKQSESERMIFKKLRSLRDQW